MRKGVEYAVTGGDPGGSVKGCDPRGRAPFPGAAEQSIDSAECGGEIDGQSRSAALAETGESGLLIFSLLFPSFFSLLEGHLNIGRGARSKIT
jgi:hypothetical protein